MRVLILVFKVVKKLSSEQYDFNINQKIFRIKKCLKVRNLIHIFIIKLPILKKVEDEDLSNHSHQKTNIWCLFLKNLFNLSLLHVK